LGDHVATFTATFAHGCETQKTVMFEVGHYPTVPEEGDIMPVEFEIQLDPQGQALESVTATLKDSEGGVLQTYNLVYDEIQEFWRWLADDINSLVVIGPDGVGLGLVFEYVAAQMETSQKIVNFLVTGGE
jgi:hypothetical protein